MGEENGGEDDASEVAAVVVDRPAVDSAVEAALVVEQDVCAAHLFQLFSFLYQELIDQVAAVDPLSLVACNTNSAGYTVPLFADCSVGLRRLPLPRTRVKVCLFSFLSS